MYINRLIAFGIIGVMLSIMATPSFTVLSFYKNQSDIIAKHCINKKKPELKCDGKCYLKKKLTKAKEEEPEPNALPEIEIYIPICVQIESDVSIERPFYTPRVSFFAKLDDTVKAFKGDIFTPPKLMVV